MIVYLVTNLTNGKRYVGKTKRDLGQRWREHVTHSHGRSEEMALYVAIRKHGADAFELSVLEECSSEETLNEAEKRWIRELGTFRREYNMTEGGDGLKGYKHTEDTKRRMSEARKGTRNHNYRKVWGRQGPLSEEARRKISEKKKGVPVHTEAYKSRLALERYVMVDQFDLEGNHLATFFSMKHAAESLGIKAPNISRACSQPQRSAGRFKWKQSKR